MCDRPNANGRIYPKEEVEKVKAEKKRLEEEAKARKMEATRLKPKI
jgi:hypothetical protein